MKKTVQTVSLTEFAANFSTQQKKIADTETDLYYLLTTFREAREKSDISQAELAKKAGINRTTLSQIESGIRNATVVTLSQLASALDMKLDIRLRKL